MEERNNPAGNDGDKTLDDNSLSFRSRPLGLMKEGKLPKSINRRKAGWSRSGFSWKFEMMNGEQRRTEV